MNLFRKHFPAVAAIGALVVLGGCDLARSAVGIVTAPQIPADANPTLAAICLEAPEEGTKDEVIANLEKVSAKRWGVSYETYDVNDLTLIRVWAENQLPLIAATIDNKQNLMCEIASETFDRLKPAP